jgi:hypothetical protein
VLVGRELDAACRRVAAIRWEQPCVRIVHAARACGSSGRVVGSVEFVLPKSVRL